MRGNGSEVGRGPALGSSTRSVSSRTSSRLVVVAPGRGSAAAAVLGRGALAAADLCTRLVIRDDLADGCQDVIHRRIAC